jgi:hypothetical protein
MSPKYSVSLHLLLRLGILEKKKDFQKRAKHLHKKKEYIDTLKEKAFLRNPEEFAYGMINAKKDTAGRLILASVKRDNPHSVKPKPDYDAKRPCVKEGKVHKYKFERRK